MNMSKILQLLIFGNTHKKYQRSFASYKAFVSLAFMSPKSSQLENFSTNSCPKSVALIDEKVITDCGAGKISALLLTWARGNIPQKATRYFLIRNF
jgi:hypothetical protein